jgi:hypothetical protein
VTTDDAWQSRLAGWLCVGAGVLDLGLAAFFYFFRRSPDERIRKFRSLAMVIAGVGLGGIGALLLSGVIALG